MMCVAFSLCAQDGLWLSNNYKHARPVITHVMRIDVCEWYQPESKKSAIGASVVYAPYFDSARSELRVSAGYLKNGNDVESNRDIIEYLVIPNSETIQLGAGFSKLFPQLNSKAYHELAFNADFLYSARYIRANDNEINISTFQVRAGFEVIPIPRRLSFYANAHLLLGVSGSQVYVSGTETPITPLERAEYFDAGFKSMFRVFKYLIVMPEFNALFTEKRMRDRMQSPDRVVPTIRLNLIVPFTFPK